jgi:hypothetical protein
MLRQPPRISTDALTTRYDQIVSLAKLRHLLSGPGFPGTKRCSLQCWAIELSFTIAGNNYKGYLSRAQSIDKISRQLTVQIESQHNRIKSVPFKELGALPLSTPDRSPRSLRL